MKHSLKPLVVILALIIATTPALACTAFLVVGSEAVLFANNEDYLNPETRVTFIPAADGRRGVMYLGFDDGFPQGGMNDAGLAFDGFATGPNPMTKQDGKLSFPGNPIKEAMETCTTVDEVIEFLSGIDLRPLLTNAMLFFADASGDAVIVEGDDFIRKNGAYQAVTNFYQSKHDDNHAVCPRYDAAVKILNARDETSVAVCTKALSAAAQRGRTVATLYSNVFELTTRRAHLYLFRDFEHPVTLDLDAELAKGMRTVRLPDLFEENPRFEAYVSYQQLTTEQRINERRVADPSSIDYDTWAGQYDIEVNGETHRVTIKAAEDRLVAESPIFRRSENRLELHAASPTEFFAIRPMGELTVEFKRDDAGEVTGFVLRAGGVSYPAAAVTDTPRE